MNSSDLFELLQDWVNQLSRSWLALDPLVQQRLQNLTGQVIEVECTEPELTAHITVVGASLELNHGAATAPNVQLRGTAPALLGRALSIESKAAVEVNGDETLLLQLLEILSGYRPDPTPALAKLIGNDPAQTLSAALELGAQTTMGLVESGIHDLMQRSTGTLQRHFTTRSNADALQNQLDDMRLRIDRAAARVQQLEQSPRSGAEQ